MRLIRLTLFLLLNACAANSIYAQSDATSWTIDAKKKSGDQYELVFHLKLKEGFHVWSANPGGDGSLIPTTFVFDKSDAVKFVGPVKEQGKLITQTFEGIDGIVHFYKDKVDFIQLVEAKKGTVITGNYTFQVCNDKLCLAPKTQKFVYNIK